MSSIGENMIEPKVILSAKNVSKRFGLMKALDDVSMQIHEGKVLALVGENGAGKSTLINIISGMIRADEGSILIDNSSIFWTHPAQALKRGIAVVHQELTLFGNLSVAENICIGNKAIKHKRKGIKDKALALLSMLEQDIDPNRPVDSLTIAEKQIVEIAKALAWNPKLLILDEATSALDSMQVDNLFKVCRLLVEKGTSIIFVSHRIPEIFKIADEALVIKDGRVVGRYESLSGVSEKELVDCMVGYSVNTIFPDKSTTKGNAPILGTIGLSNEFIKDVTMQIYPGEIIGLGGLKGHGQEMLLRTLFGIEKVTSGEIELEGKSYHVKNVEHAIKSGFAYIPPDRKSEGIVLDLPIENNLSVVILRQLSNAIGHIHKKKEEETLQNIRSMLRINQKTWKQLAGYLSGGNQQKVVLGKWLKSNFKVLLMDEPTRGVDIATKHEIYIFLRELAAQGACIIFASTDSIELLGISDRVYIFYEGKVHAELDKNDLTEDKVTFAIMGM
jgi:ribose transport system ATP-binding protein